VYSKLIILISTILILTNVCPVLAAASMSDVLSNSNKAITSHHDIDIELGDFILTTNGSVKITFDNNFNLSGLLSADVSVTGGNVTWQVPIVDIPGKSITVAYLGDLDQTDVALNIQVGNINYITNPVNIGSYPVRFYVHENNDGTGDIHYQTSTVVAINNVVNVQAEISETLSFTVSGVGGGQIVNGATTTLATTTNNINFGTLNGANTQIAAQNLTVNTNATGGFTVTIRYLGNLASGTNIINNFTGTNAIPTTWTTPPSGGTEGYFGYTTNDTTLGTGSANRFATNKWAGLSTSPLEIFYHPDPTAGTGTGIGTTRVGYKIDITNFQASGTYTTTVNYVCTATY